MNSNQIKAAIVMVAFLLAAGAYVYLQYAGQDTVGDVKSLPSAVLPQENTEPQSRLPLPANTGALTTLDSSDQFMLEKLRNLADGNLLVQLLHIDHLIRNLVVTVDNLQGRKLPQDKLPYNPVPGKFLASTGSEGMQLSAENAARYKLYVELFEALNIPKMVGIYRSTYPLFQDAYREIGYPDGDFNGKLLEVIDELLDAPDVKGPVKLVRPKVFYLYADPELESLSIGQRMMIRVGADYSARLKIVLKSLRDEIQRQMNRKS